MIDQAIMETEKMFQLEKRVNILRNLSNKDCKSLVTKEELLSVMDFLIEKACKEWKS